jgi:hypothetical protein
VVTNTSFTVCRGKLAVAVRVLGLVLVEQPLVVFVRYQGLFFVADLAVLGGKHGHLIGVVGQVVVVDDRFHRLHVVFTLVTVYVVTMNVDGAWALAHFAVLVDFFIVVQAGCPLWLHIIRDAPSLSTGLGDCAVAVLVFLIGHVDLWREILIGVIVHFNFVV